MKYVCAFFAATLVFIGVALASVVFLTPAPIRAEYWVREMIAVKRHILASYSGQRKVVILSGSNSLFNVDTSTLTTALRLPVINFGLHKAMPLEEILAEGAAGVSEGDVIVLPLEPNYYCEAKQTGWQVRNQIAWDRARWSKLSMQDKIEAASRVGPVLPFEVGIARAQQAFFPKAVAARIEALNDANTLDKFAHAARPAHFAYSAYNIDSLGNMRGTEGSTLYGGGAVDASLPTKVCHSSLSVLSAFSEQMHRRGVRVLFAGTPYMSVSGLDLAKVNQAGAELATELAGVAPFVDSRETMLFERRLFLDTSLHLNAEGRKIRTEKLLISLRNAGLGPSPK